MRPAKDQNLQMAGQFDNRSGDTLLAPCNCTRRQGPRESHYGDILGKY